jgi:hypothetical protein
MFVSNQSHDEISFIGIMQSYFVNWKIIFVWCKQCLKTQFIADVFSTHRRRKKSFSVERKIFFNWINKFKLMEADHHWFLHDFKKQFLLVKQWQYNRVDYWCNVLRIVDRKEICLRVTEIQRIKIWWNALTDYQNNISRRVSIKSTIVWYTFTRWTCELDS